MRDLQRLSDFGGSVRKHRELTSVAPLGRISRCQIQAQAPDTAPLVLLPQFPGCNMMYYRGQRDGGSNFGITHQ